MRIFKSNFLPLLQIILPSISLHPVINFPLYFIGLKIKIIIRMVMACIIIITGFIFYDPNALNHFLANYMYPIAFSYIAFFILYRKRAMVTMDDFNLDILSFLIFCQFSLWLIFPKIIEELFNHEFGYRFSGWSREPSFFSEIIFTYLIFTMVSDSIFRRYLGLSIVIVFYIESMAATLILILSATVVTYLIFKACKAFKTPTLWTSLILIVFFLLINLLIYDFSIEVGSWRSVSNIESLRNFKLFPSVERNEDLIRALTINGFESIEGSIYSLYFYLFASLGLLIGVILLSFIMFFLRNALNKMDLFGLSIVQKSFVAAGYLNAWFLSPKWLIITSLPLLFLLGKRNILSR